MGKVSNFFTMTRHERAGALAVMALIAITTVALWAARCCTSSDKGHPPTPPAMEEFNAATDSGILTEKPKQKKRKGKTRGKGDKRTKKKRDKNPQPTPSKPKDRDLDEIPNF